MSNGPNESQSRTGPAAAKYPAFLTVFPSIMLPMFLAVVDQTIIATALPAIAASTGQFERASWIVVSYLIASTIAAPIYGRLGDAFGRRRLMFVALAVFMVASLLCAASPTIELLTLARLLQGLGGGGLMTLSQALIPTPGGEQTPVSQVARVSYSRGPSMIRDEDGSLTGYVYLNLKSSDYGGFVKRANALLIKRVALPAGYTWRWAGEYEFEMRAKQRLVIILPIVFFVIFLLLYLIFQSAAEAAVLIFPTFYAMSGGLLLQWLLGYNFSVAVWVGYIALFGIAVETGVVMVVYLRESLDERLSQGVPLTEVDLEQAAITGAVQRLRPKLMTVTAVILSLAPILWESGIGSDVMKPIAAPIVGGMITSTIHVLILVPVFFVILKERSLRKGRLGPRIAGATPDSEQIQMR